MSSIKREGLGAGSCQNLSWQTERPIVRLLNGFEQRRLDVVRLMVSFGVHNFRVQRWHFDDSVGFNTGTAGPDVYLFRDLALEICIQQLPVVMWFCDELALEEPPCCICPVYGEEWSAAQRAKLSLLFGAPVEEGSICSWVRVPEGEVTLWLNGYPLKS